MNEQDIVDFESEIRKVCEKYEAKMAHATLVGVLTVVRHLYLNAQLNKNESPSQEFLVKREKVLKEKQMKVPIKR